jgi:predicted nucleic acid-binding Zn ribbon protein
MTDDPIKVCPKCEAEAVRRVINQVGIVFKGSGFYVTDNRSKSKSKSRAGESSGKSAESTDSTEKAEKPKTESKTKEKSASVSAEK